MKWLSVCAHRVHPPRGTGAPRGSVPTGLGVRRSGLSLCEPRAEWHGRAADRLVAERALRPKVSARSLDHAVNDGENRSPIARFRRSSSRSRQTRMSSVALFARERFSIKRTASLVAVKRTDQWCYMMLLLMMFCTALS